MAVDVEDPLQIDRMICFQIYAASNMLTRLYRPMLAGLGLTYPQYLVMLVLWETHPEPRAYSVGVLGTRLHLDSGTLTPLLKRLELAGLITRTRDAADERRVLVAPTAAGSALRERALPVPDTLRAELGLTPAQQRELLRSIGSMVDALSLNTERG